MSGFVKAGQTFLKALMSGGKQKTTGTEVIKSVKPGTTFKGTPKYQKDIIEARSKVMKKFKPINEGIAKQTKELRQTLQKVRGTKRMLAEKKKEATWY